MGYDLISGNVIPAVTGGVFSFVRVITASDILLTSPASILAAYIKGQGLMSNPAANMTWPLFISRIPDGTGVATSCGAIYDTTPIKDGRLMVGPIIQHYGLQIMIRSADHNVGWKKLEAVSVELDSINNEFITVSDEEYQIYNIKRMGTIISLGAEEGTEDRRLFTANFIVTLKRIV